MKKNKKLILGLIGEMGCGKGAVSEYARTKYQASTYLFSDLLREVMRTLSIEITRKNLSKLSRLLRENFGQDLLAKAIYEKAKNDNNKLVIVDGIRRMPDLKYLKKLPEFKLARVVVSSEIRYERLTKRTQNVGDNTKTYKEFLRDHKLETEVDIPKIMKTAKIEINNEGTFKDLQNAVDAVIKKNL